MLTLGPLRVDPPTVLAPMAGVTDQDFRLLVRRIGGVGMVSMEFLSARGLAEGDRRFHRLLPFTEEERPLAIQIYGADATTMAAAARLVEQLRPDVCDVNMGCPANKILKGCAGAALMGDLGRAREIVRAVRREVSIPLTVKFRLGLDEARESYLELARICEGEGADAVTLHARTASQGYGGKARWSAIARLKEAVGIPVIGNGDVATGADAVALLRETGCDGVMVGRGATRNPWIFAEIAAALDGSRHRPPALAERRALILEHFRTIVAREDEVRALHKLRKFTGLYALGLPGGQALRRRIQGLAEPAEFFDLVEAYFAGEIPRAA